MEGVAVRTSSPDNSVLVSCTEEREGILPLSALENMDIREPKTDEMAGLSTHVLVSSLDDMTELQRAELLGCDLFALDCEGVDLGRSGTICIVQLSTPSTCYLFDVLGLNSMSDLTIFLKVILEDQSKIKIIHDCKMDADALLHLCGIHLSGVHDTQAWDVALRGGIGLSLNKTLQAYGCTINAQRDHNLYLGNPSFWATRPLTPLMIDWASGDVRHLFDLHRAQVNTAALAGPEVGALCVAQSEENADRLRDLVMAVRVLSTHTTLCLCHVNIKSISFLACAYIYIFIHSFIFLLLLRRHLMWHAVG